MLIALLAWQLNGDAALVDHRIRLTNDLGQAGSAFIEDAVSAHDGFSVFFSFIMTESRGAPDADGPGADGITFTLASEPRALGLSGGSLGIRGAPAQSVSIEFDTYQNHGELESANHVGVMINGENMARVDTAPRFNDGNLWCAWIDYDGAVIAVRVRQRVCEKPRDVTLAYRIHIAPELAFAGFTAATGDGGAVHEIVDVRIAR